VGAADGLEGEGLRLVVGSQQSAEGGALPLGLDGPRLALRLARIRVRARARGRGLGAGG